MFTNLAIPNWGPILQLQVWFLWNAPSTCSDSPPVNLPGFDEKETVPWIPSADRIRKWVKTKHGNSSYWLYNSVSDWLILMND